MVINPLHEQIDQVPAHELSVIEPTAIVAGRAGVAERTAARMRSRLSTAFLLGRVGRLGRRAPLGPPTAEGLLGHVRQGS